MKKFLINTLKILGILYLSICIFLFFFQENLIFHPQKLDKKFSFEFDRKFEELNIKTEDTIALNGLLFRADSSKGLVFYLHGNSGSLRGWGNIAKHYNSRHYDIFMIDYRGFGKSDGEIDGGEEQVFKDIQTVYDTLKLRYNENKIVVIGYSIGTGPATMLASTNHPRQLILQAPYFSLIDMMQHEYPGVPTFILNYKFQTNKYICECKMPVTIFHGNKDQVIYYNSSVQLKALCKVGDKFITLSGLGHNGINDDERYLKELDEILKN
ncbi:MAG: alpha/beta fold hydrolase [Bacteroidetes bacterium]|nr:alpha/beta fold hydrolase [Bacteroidota bacterium]